MNEDKIKEDIKKWRSSKGIFYTPVISEVYRAGAESQQAEIVELRADKALLKEMYDTASGSFADGLKGVQEALEGRYAKIEAENKDLKEALEESIEQTCFVCRILNPQHKECTTCGDIEHLLKALKEA